MKLIVQIPCYNEAETLPATLADLPDSIPGIETIEILIIDDGSTDGTADVARDCGADRVVRLPGHQGLAKAFARGLAEASRMNADVVVNTDADNQYPGRFIEPLIAPILDGGTDIVIGCRPIEHMEHFSNIKKRLQRLGSRMVAWLTGVNIPDVTSGFRAYSRRAVHQLKVFSDFTYTIETVIQASKSGLQISTVPIQTNPPTRPSRLFQSNFSYIRRQATTIFRVWALYSPGKLFSSSALVSLGIGGLLVLRFLYYYILAYPEPSGKIQSLIIASIFLSLGFSLLLFGVVTDLIGVNRKLMEDAVNRLDALEEQSQSPAQADDNDEPA